MLIEKIGNDLRDELRRVVQQMADEITARNGSQFPSDAWHDHQATVMYLKGVAAGINTALRLLGGSHG